ncbi:MAG: Ig-like domain-containing protein, partial [Alphaproteobacteria bacterium]
HTLLVHATDAAGNVDATDATHVWTVDTTPPDTTVVDGPAALTSDTTATFDFGPDEAGITFQAKLDDGSYSEVSDPLALSGLGEGVHTLLVHATDAAGNVDTTDCAYVWTVDATAPETTIVDGPDGLTNETTATFDFGPAEPGITFTAKLDDGGFSEVPDPLTLSGLDDGRHTLLVYATDALGNVDATPAEFVWTVDATAPETTIIDGPDGLTNETTATFDFGPAEPGITFTGKLDDGSYSEVSDPLALSGLSEGVHTLLVRAIDAAGNEDTTPAEHVWTIDTTPPDTTILGAPSGLVASAAAAVTFTGEADATFEANLDGGGWSAAASPLALAGLGEGAHTLLVRAVDAAGNADATPAAATWTVDTLPPGTTILQGPAAATNQTSAVFDFGSGDAGVTYEASLDGGGYSAVPDPATFGGLAEGAHTLLVRAVDAAGNSDPTPASRIWTIDTTAPPAPAVTGFADDTGEQGDGLTTDRTLSVHGTGAPGSVVHVLRDGAEIGASTVGGGGDWLFADTATLAFGKHAYTAFATDALANPSGLSDPMAVLVADTKASAGSGGDLLPGGAGSGSFDGKEGNDTIFGEAGNDTVKGGNGADWLSGGGDQDALWGGNGNDTVAGGSGRDTLYGEAGDDALSGDAGDDRIEGGAGADSIDGGNGADSLWGGDGSDTIVGGAGTDRIFGDGGGDWIVLGLDGAKDSVVGSVAHLSGDTVLGFETGKGGDAIVITGLASTSGKYLDSLALIDGVLSLTKVGGGTILFDDLAGTHYTDTVLGSDGSVLIYVV